MTATDAPFWPRPITAITLFVDDVTAARSFYAEVFGLDVHYEDDVSVVFDFGNTLINLLQSSEAMDLIAPARVSSAAAGAAVQFTITVDNVDATCELVIARGATLLNGPIDRAWGIRTAAFRDPAGHIWEVAT